MREASGPVFKFNDGDMVKMDDDYECMTSGKSLGGRIGTVLMSRAHDHIEGLMSLCCVEFDDWFDGNDGSSLSPRGALKPGSKSCWWTRESWLSLVVG